MKMLLLFTYYSIFIILATINIYPQLDDVEKIKSLSVQELVKNKSENEKKIDPPLFYQIVAYKKDILNGKNEILSLNQLKEHYKSSQFRDNKILITIRLNTKDQKIIDEIKPELLALDCEITNSYSGHNNFIEFTAWVLLDKILNITKLKQVMLVEPVSPFFFR